MEENPIYDFHALREFLIEKGYIVENASGYKEIKPEEVTIDAINKGQIEFEDNGIFVLNTNNEKIQVFLYKRDYRLKEFGKPRFHICKCDTINEFITWGLFKHHYVRANADPVPVFNMDDGYIEEMVDNLPLCKRCLEKITEYGKISSSEFVEILKQANAEVIGNNSIEVDIFGYTKDWERISREFRERHNYTCEECGLKIENVFDRQYMHVHHVDSNKMNNKVANLKCLCLRCHANKDDFHFKRLTTGANRIIWEAFNAAYPLR